MKSKVLSCWPVKLLIHSRCLCTYMEIFVQGGIVVSIKILVFQSQEGIHIL